MVVSRHPIKQWVFTINNWTTTEYEDLAASAPTLWKYLIIGKETGEEGTPHLQCFGILNTKRRLRQVKQLPGLSRAHLEMAQGTPIQASDYCKKDKDFEEFGELPTSQGKRNEFERFREWLLAQEERPTDAELFIEFPSLYGRYRQNLLHIMDVVIPRPRLVPESAELRQWQRTIDQRVRPDGQFNHNDRRVFVIVDTVGNSGKSFMTRWWLSDIDIKSQVLMVGRRDDLAHAIDAECELFIFDIPRGELQFFQWSIVEQLKNGIIFSPKYQSGNKFLRKGSATVVVFTNEEPDRTKLSKDRWCITRIRQA
ncbi:replication protein A [Mute swan feces associated circular virus 13]|nr:replication protein A [Mute swan feces associated circular virus 13]